MVKAVHLEPVSESTSKAFIATLERFIARRGKPSVDWSEHGTHFVGTVRVLDEICKFTDDEIRRIRSPIFFSEQSIEWTYTPEHAQHFGGLWEVEVKKLQTTSQTCRWRRTPHLRGADHQARDSRGMLKFEAADFYAKFR